MAKIKTAEHIQDIRGGVKNHVYSGWRGRGYLRSKTVSGSNPRSTAQAGLRARMSSSSRYWSQTLTEVQRQLWNEYAQKRSQFEHLPRVSNPIISPRQDQGSGYNMFVRNNLILQSSGILTQGQFLSDPPSLSGLAMPNPPTELSAVWGTVPVNVFFEDFEDELVGVTPNGWTPPWVYTFAPPSVIITANDQAYSAPNSAKLTSVNTNFASARRSIPELAFDGAQIDYYCRIAQEVNTTLFQSTRDAAGVNSIYALGYNFNKKWYLFYGGGAVELGSYVKDQWYHIRFVLNPSAFTFDFYVDDMVNPLIANAAFTNNVVPGSITLGTGIQTVTTWVDNIVVSYPPASSIRMTWTDPIDIDPDAKIRIWLDSYDTSVHLQQVDTVSPGFENYALCSVRVAQGKSTPVCDMPGNYRVQIDHIDPGGQQSAPSNLVTVTIPNP